MKGKIKLWIIAGCAALVILVIVGVCAGISKHNASPVLLDNKVVSDSTNIAGDATITVGAGPMAAQEEPSVEEEPAPVQESTSALPEESATETEESADASEPAAIKTTTSVGQKVTQSASSGQKEQPAATQSTATATAEPKQNTPTSVPTQTSPTKSSTPSPAPTSKPEEDIPPAEEMKWETFYALSSEEKDAFLESFDDYSDFVVWMNNAQAQFKKDYPDIVLGADGSFNLSDILK